MIINMSLPQNNNNNNNSYNNNHINNDNDNNIRVSKENHNNGSSLVTDSNHYKVNTSHVHSPSAAILPPMSSTNPDLISHQPVTSQPGGSHSTFTVPWTYTPSGPLPLGRSDMPSMYGSTTTIYSHKSHKSTGNGNGDCGIHPSDVTEMDNVSLSAEIPSHTRASIQSSSAPTAGSRDWSRSIFGAFRDVKKSEVKLPAVKTFCRECWCVPCMMCSVSRSLGDKCYLPFIPGTGAAIRFKVRILGGIEGSIADDCLVTSCCCPCAVCQMYREIDDIGLGPT